MKNASANAWALVAAFTMLAGCGSGADVSPFAQQQQPTTDGGGGTDPGNHNPPPSSTDSGSPASSDGGVLGDAATGPAMGMGCGTTPARYVVLGHSVAHCFAVGGPSSETCAF